MAHKSWKYLIIIFVAGVLFSGRLSAQRMQVENLETFQYRPYYFGFVLGFNSMDFVVHPEKATFTNDSLFTVSSYPEYGFQIGILANKRIKNHLHLRFATVLAFGERLIDYRIVFADSSIVQTKKIESTFIEFPLSFKYGSRRLNNFGAYILGGAKYGIDLASQAGKKEQTEDLLIKLKPNDISAELGVGFDFYLPYFKFGIELKRSFGLNDLLIRENNLFTNDIKRLNSKIYQLSFTFEG